MDCLPIPLEESPPGRWHCPICPPLDPNNLHPQEIHYEIHQEASVPSTSQSPGYSAKGGGGLQGKSFLPNDRDVDWDIHEASVVFNKNSRPKSVKKGKARKPIDDPDDERHSPLRQTKRMRLRISSPHPLPRIRLRLGKGRDRDEDEEPKKGIFDDILSVDDRDTTKTLVEQSDKQRFERSRNAAEVNDGRCGHEFGV
jgi:hypothetical protein